MKTPTLLPACALAHLLASAIPAAENPLSLADGRVVFGVESQTRFEYRENNFDFNRSIRTINDDSWLLQRSRVNVNVEPTPWLTLFAEGQDSREIGSRRADLPGVLGAEGDNPFDLRQAWFEIGDETAFPLTLKAGRQVLLYGDQRLIGPLDWNNISRTFDAAKLRWHGQDGLWVDLFTSSVVVPNRGGFDESNWHSIFSGLYAHIPTLDFQDTELYALHLRDTNLGHAFGTFGAHLKSQAGAIGPWDYEAEFAVQTGRAGHRDLRAFAGYVEGGRTFDHAWKPRVGLEYSYGSGDSNPADGVQGAFQNLFPTNHPHYGLMDAFSWSNLHDLVLHLSAKPAAKFTANLDFHVFWLDETADTWRRANASTAVRPASPGVSNYAGSELDLVLTCAISEPFRVTAGYSHFFAGDYLAATGAGSDADFFYLMSSLKF